jgi:3',5'-cyclic AMP phosphodiesterase CpdA
MRETGASRRIAHLSDLHFGAVPPGAPERLLRDLAAIAPDLICISGDLTQRALAHQFAACRTFLAALPAPFLAVPGNHDIPGAAVWERLLDPFGRWRRHLGLPTEAEWEDAALLVVGLNTTRSWAPHLDWSAGRLSARQRRRIEIAGRRRAGRALVLVAHHPPEHPPPFAWRRPLGDAARARACFVRAGVAAILLGHLHRPARMGEAVPELQAGSALSWRDGGDGNSYTVIDFGVAAFTARVRRLRQGEWQWAEALVPCSPVPPPLPGPACGETVAAPTGGRG